MAGAGGRRHPGLDGTGFHGDDEAVCDGGPGATFLAVSNCGEEMAAGKMRAISLAPERMVRRLGLIYRKDKALSKAALGFIQVVLEHMGEEARTGR